ncbi:hypothetical protein MBAV_000761 [Candidatus Magnetobacterium bavaricum]|uniref:Uncharacterized protein n=1 Tax=Candidatus Magnetobacterium bavaricum TaxID=29290 RepID=A0A0F3GYQ8_9BACT|nr:hypothetical protein MBAV_000761 [Candidatus Magnetobacterium bavaricum]
MPLPLPELPDVTVIQPTLLVAVHVQPLVAATSTVSTLMDGLAFLLVGVIA